MIIEVVEKIEKKTLYIEHVNFWLDNFGQLSYIDKSKPS